MLFSQVQQAPGPDIRKVGKSLVLIPRLPNSCLVPLSKYMCIMWHSKLYLTLKDKDYCPIEIIKGLTDKGQFQYLTKLMGPQEGTYLYATQFHSLR